MSVSLARLRGPVFVLMGLTGVSFDGTIPAVAADDGYANVFSSVLGATGVIKPDSSPEIEYRERPPLVLPPPTLTQLPKPAVPGAKRTAAWPQDPDVVRRRKAAEEARAPVPLEGGDRAERIKAGELQKGRAVAGEEVEPNHCGVNGNSPHCLVVDPTVLKAEGDRYAASNPDGKDLLQPGQEPERVYLTQPPKGYMVSTKVVKATTEAPEQRIDEASPRAYNLPKKTDE